MRYATPYRLIAIVSVLGIAQLLTACGQKGDLYLPKAPTPSAAEQSGQGAAARNSSGEDSEGGNGPTSSQAADPPQ